MTRRLVTLPSAPRRPVPRSVLRLVALLALLPDVFCASASGWLIEPTVSIGETLTDNHRLAPEKSGDAVTQATAGLHVSSGAGRVTGFLDYSLTALGYARHSNLNEFQNALSSAATAELWDKRAFVDVRANIAQQAISAFGTQAPDAARAQDNRTEVRSISVAPYLSGRLAGRVDYDLRLSHEATDTSTSTTSNVSNTMAALNLSGGGAVLKWSAVGSRQITDFSEGRRTEDDRLRGQLRYVASPELAISASAGRESNDFLTPEKQSHATWGAKVDWIPSVRTSLSANYEHRFFGESHSVTFSHRTARTIWTFIDSRDVSVNNSQVNVRLGSTYDLFFTQFASAEPDPVRRDVLVRSFLQTNGIDPNTSVIGGFLASAATLERLQSLSFALVGLRSTLTVRATQSRSRRLDVLSGASDDLSAASEVRQRGATVDVAHRLTSISSLNVGAAYQRTTGSLETQATTMKSLSATWTAETGRRSNLLAGVRHVVFDSATAPYTENALFATFLLRF